MLVLPTCLSTVRLHQGDPMVYCRITLRKLPVCSNRTQRTHHRVTADSAHPRLKRCCLR